MSNDRAKSPPSKRRKADVDLDSPEYYRRQARWVERMQNAGLFPKPAEPPAEPPPPGHWRMTSAPNGMVFVEINDVVIPDSLAPEFLRLVVSTET